MRRKSRRRVLSPFVLCTLALSACLGDLFGLQTESEADAVAPEAPMSRYRQCFALRERTDYKMLAAAEFTRRLEPGATFEDEVPISPHGCVRYTRRVEDGVVTQRAMRLALGYLERVPGAAANAVQHREAEVWLSREDLGLNRRHAEFDNNADGFAELVIDTWLDAQGFMHRVMTTTDRLTQQVIARKSLTSVSASEIRWVEEKLVDGKLTVTRDQVAPAEMDAKLEVNRGCYNPGEREVTCSSDETRKTRAALLAMLPRAVACLGDDSGEDAEQELLAHLIKTQADEIWVRCLESDVRAGSMNPTTWTPYRVNLLTVNVEMFRCQDDNFVQAVLFHEVLHLARGPHPPEVTPLARLPQSEGGFSHQAFVYTDQLRSCEEYCFGELRTRCSCASCRKTTTCDPRCSREASCREYHPLYGFTMSDAVGALCAQAPNPDGGAPGPRWHATLASCQAGCGPNQCKSYSLSCDKNCN